MAKIIVSKPIKDDGITKLMDCGHEVLVHDEVTSLSQDELILKCQGADALISMLSDKIDKKFFNSCPSIKVVSNYAVGFNNIDVEYATKNRIAIGNTPDVLTNATADLAFSLMLDLGRKIKPAHKNVIEGNWQGWEPKGFMGRDFRGQTLGIFGAGRIGQEFANLCYKAFDMKIIYCARSTKAEFEKRTSAKKVEFDSLLEKADVISLHCDLNGQTKNIINKSSLAKTTRSPIFINTARGEMHNEIDLLWALENKKLESIALDVTNPEPMLKSNPLLTRDDCIITPHIGSATHKARSAMSLMVANNIMNALAKRPLEGDVNKIFS